MLTLREWVAQLHQCRLDAAQAKAELESSRRRWEEENRSLIAKAEGCRLALVATEDEVRRVAVECFQVTGDKSPAPGVGIRMMRRLDYDSAKALDWAVAHRLALKLDQRQFEKLAVEGMVEEVWIQVVKEPQATIATDLASALASTITT